MIFSPTNHPALLKFRNPISECIELIFECVPYDKSALNLVKREFDFVSGRIIFCYKLIVWPILLIESLLLMSLRVYPFRNILRDRVLSSFNNVSFSIILIAFRERTISVIDHS